MHMGMKRFAVAGLCLLSLAGCVVYEDRHHTPGVTPVQKADVLSLRASGAPDDQILDMIQRNGVARKPTADEVVELSSAGVSSRVMNAMMEAPVTTYRPPTEVRHRYYDYEPAFRLGSAALTGYLIGRHFRH